MGRPLVLSAAFSYRVFPSRGLTRHLSNWASYYTRRSGPRLASGEIGAWGSSVLERMESTNIYGEADEPI